MHIEFVFQNVIACCYLMRTDLITIQVLRGVQVKCPSVQAEDLTCGAFKVLYYSLFKSPRKMCMVTVLPKMTKFLLFRLQFVD